MKTVLSLVFVVVAACGGKSSEPAPIVSPQPRPAAETSSAISPEQCVAKGGQVRGDIGDGKIACAAGERDLGRVSTGIEGGVCCAPPVAAPTP